MLTTCYLFNLLPNDAVKSGIQSNHCVEFFSTSIPTNRECGTGGPGGGA